MIEKVKINYGEEYLSKQDTENAIKKMQKTVNALIEQQEKQQKEIAFLYGILSTFIAIQVVKNENEKEKK